MATGSFTFTEKTKSELDEMDSVALSKEMATMTAFKDLFFEEYRTRMEKYDKMIAKKMTDEKKERDKDPIHKAKAQGVGI
jgi:hypothetical protein